MYNLEEYNSCRLCPRECHADRLHGYTGYCRVTSELKVARAALHMWEEPCISGTNGSGAVFFSGCSMDCVFCQNHDISKGENGKSITIERLCSIFLELQEKGAHNINLVTPDHYVPSIIPAIEMARKQNLHIPIICNCSGYMRLETVQMLEGYIDVWLPDFKYYSDEAAVRYSSAPNYFSIASAALLEMFRQCGSPVFDDAGMITRGMIVRHLILPGHEDDSCQIIDYLYHTYGDQIYISIMNQFTPTPTLIPHFPELNRKVSDLEYDRVVDYALDIGIENGFIQEGETASESFIPPFNNEGV